VAKYHEKQEYKAKHAINSKFVIGQVVEHKLYQGVWKPKPLKNNLSHLKNKKDFNDGYKIKS